MRLASLRIRHYRTVGGTEVELPLDRSLTLVGPNNSGKTNLLRAIEAFFTGHDNNHGYEIDRDLTFGSPNVKTSLLATFRGCGDRHFQGHNSRPHNNNSFDDISEATEQVEGTNSDSDVHPIVAEDSDFFESFDRLHSLYGRVRHGSTFTLSLVFSRSGVPTYQFFPNLKKPSDNATQAAISRLQRQLVTDLLTKFACHYIPSAKSIQQLYEKVLSPFLKKAAARAVAPQLNSLSGALDQVATSINQELQAVGLESLKASFAIPDEGIAALLSPFEFNMMDPHRTPLSRKGQGIQITAFLAALRWVSAEEASAGRQTVWLLEEPESYLHPQLMSTVRQILTRLAIDSTIVATTHSLAFVPDDVREVRGVRLGEDGRTEVEEFHSSSKAGESLRAELGIKFSDYYNLGQYNVVVEGKSDRELLKWYLQEVPEDVASLARLREARIEDFGGVKHLAGWMRATYQHVRAETPLVAMFDGDAAGERERRDLRAYFSGMGVPFEANHQYVIVRSGFPIEGLFPDAWLIEMHEQHPAWFGDFALDVSGSLQTLQIEDSKKGSVQGWLRRMAKAQGDQSWATRFEAVVRALESALQSQESSIKATSWFSP